MESVNPMMRLKMKRDTFFLPDMDGGVYFRNNEGSFRIEGKSIYQWIEKLLPEFNGQQTLKDLTDGLPDSYKKRIYEIAGVLYLNGFARDVSNDLPHHLSERILSQFEAQIEFLDSLAGSGANRFQTFRKTKSLAVGSGPFFVSLIGALLESGLPCVSIFDTEKKSQNDKRIKDIVKHAKQNDPEVELKELTIDKKIDGSSLRAAVAPFDAVLYVSEEGNIDELVTLQTICKEEKKLFIPAICTKQSGIAGPVIHPDDSFGFESMWHRIHDSALNPAPFSNKCSPVALSVLSNILAFELFKTMSGAVRTDSNSQFYLLNLCTLEGGWHSFYPHPNDGGFPCARRIDDITLLMKESDPLLKSELLPYFAQLTDVYAGIFQTWEEADLPQLPLSQCLVQAVNPLSNGPCTLLPEVVCSGLTHEDARFEAGLIGIEDYVQQMTGKVLQTHSGFVGVGTGRTAEEAIWRGLIKCLTEELTRQHDNKPLTLLSVQVDSIDNEKCAFYLQALRALNPNFVVGVGESVLGFPVIWVGIEGRFVGCVGLNQTMALESALEQTLMEATAKHESKNQKLAEKGVCKYLDKSTCITNGSMLELLKVKKGHDICSQDIQVAIEILKQNGKQMAVFDLAVEPFLKEGIAGVFGVSLQQEESL